MLTEKSLNLIPSVIFHNNRIRFVGNKAYNRPPNETFHEFIEFLAIEILGYPWWKSQAGMLPERQHILFRYADDYNKRKRSGSLIAIKEEIDGSRSCIPSGPTLYWLSFCYDLFCLSHKRLMTPELIKRLKNRDYYQGARYEIAVTAIVLQANCNISWINKDSFEHKTAEFQAFHIPSGTKFCAEAKSRKKPGVINEPGEIIKESKGFTALLKDATKKNTPTGSHLVVFIDANLHASTIANKHLLLEDTKRAIGSLSEDQDSFSLLVVTNFSFHYGDFDQPTTLGENCIVFPNHNNLLSASLMNDLTISLNSYARNIPETL